jgi:hypothetical protein
MKLLPFLAQQIEVPGEQFLDAIGLAKGESAPFAQAWRPCWTVQEKNCHTAGLEDMDMSRLVVVRKIMIRYPSARRTVGIVIAQNPTAWV